MNIEGTAAIETDDIVPGHIAVNEVMRGTPFTPPEGFEAGLRAQGRVIIRVTPSASPASSNGASAVKEPLAHRRVQTGEMGKG